MACLPTRYAAAGSAKLLGGGMTPQEIITAAQTQDGPAGLRHNAFVAFSTAYDILAQAEET